MQDVKPGGDGTAPTQSSAPDVPTPGRAPEVPKPLALIAQPSPSPVKPVAQARLRRGLLVVGLLAVLASACGGGLYWWKQHQTALPYGIVSGNGRVEADDIDITPKYAGRIATLLVDEGDLVKAGQVVARMDTRDTEAQLAQSEAQMKLVARYYEEASARRKIRRSICSTRSQWLCRFRSRSCLCCLRQAMRNRNRYGAGESQNSGSMISSDVSGSLISRRT